MPITIKIPAVFRHVTANKAELCFTAPPGKLNLKRLFEEVEKDHPGLSPVVFGKDGKASRFTGIYVNSKPYQTLHGVYTELLDNDIVEITSAIVQE